MLDEDQAVTTKDIGSVQEIDRWCKTLGSSMEMRGETRLVSQFRCNGSDAYIQFIDNLLQRGETMAVPLRELNYDFRVFDDGSGGQQGKETGKCQKLQWILLNGAGATVGFHQISDPGKGKIGNANGGDV